MIARWLASRARAKREADAQAALAADVERRRASFEVQSYTRNTIAQKPHRIHALTPLLMTDGEQ